MTDIVKTVYFYTFMDEKNNVFLNDLFWLNIVFPNISRRIAVHIAIKK